MIKNTGHQFLVTVSKCFLRVALRRYYKQACWHLAVVQEGLGPPSPPTHYLTPLTARTEATIQGDVLQNTFRLFLCLLKRGFSPSIRNWAFWLALINTFCTKHWTFQFQVILHLLHCLSGKKTGFVVSLGILVETKTKGGLTWTQLQFLRKLGHAMNVNKCLIFSAITLRLRSHSLWRVFSRDMFFVLPGPPKVLIWRHVAGHVQNS